MKKNLLLTLIGISSLLLLISGCSKNNDKETISHGTKNEANQEEIDNQEDSQNQETTDNQDVDDLNENQSSNQGAVNTDNTYTWEEITVTIPESWKDRYVIRTSEDGFYFFQKSSYEINEGMGLLCGFYRSTVDVFDGIESTPLAYTNDTLYCASYPSDVSYYQENEEIANEYGMMSKELPIMEKSIHIDKDNVSYDPSEYVLPMSNTKLYSKEYLTCFDDNQLWIARNEIYARYGREFENVYLQHYFESCSWYVGTVATDKFDESILNENEKFNLKAIKSAEEEYSKDHPYPKRYKVGEQLEVDLDGDGKKNTFDFQLKNAEGDRFNYKAYITIDGTTFDLEEYGIYLISPEEKVFYITDLADNKSGLEIAILDYGPSYDLETNFFTYNGKLEYIGTVSGFPFKEYSGYDGFANPLTITGTIRADLIHTCFAYADWRYDVDNNKLIFQENGYYPMVENSHELYVDLPVYYEMNEDSVTSIIKAQQEVFFVSTDAKEWIEVKAKDGTKGFMHIKDQKVVPLGRKATDVFSNLFFAD